MASLVLGVAGAVVGSTFGMPGLGFAVGSALGSALFPPAGGPDVEGPRIDNLRVQGSAYGQFIPIIYGTYRVAGNIIWADDLKEIAKTESAGGKGGGGGQDVTTYSYTGSFASSLCEGEISQIRRIWADGLLIYDATGDTLQENYTASGFTIYMGSETQLPDPTMESVLGLGNVPAYRGQCYVVFADLALGNFGNRLPSITAEINVKSNVAASGAEQLVIDTTEARGGSGLVYNPERDEVWHLMDSTFHGIDIFDPISATSIGAIDTTSVAAGILDGEYANLQYDAINGRIYALTYSPAKIVYFDAATATIEGNYTWTGIQYFTTSKTTGTLWGVVASGGTGKLQQKNALTGTVTTDVAIPGFGSSYPYIYSDTDGNLWLQSQDWIKRYNVGTSTFDVTVTDTDDFYKSTYDPVRHSIWYATNTNTNYTGRTVTNISNAYPAIVTHSTGAGPGFPTGTDVTISFVTGITELFEPMGGERTFTVTNIDATHFSIDVDTSGMSSYTSGGSAATNFNVLKEYDIGTATITNTVQSQTYYSMFYDEPHALVWLLGRNGNDAVGINTADGTVAYRLAVPPNYGPNFGIMAGSDLWLDDGSYETIWRIRVGGVATPTGAVTTGSIVKDISLRCDLTEDQIDVTKLTTIVEGFCITSNMNGRGALEPLARGYAFDNVDSDGKIKYVPRGGKVAALIPYSHLVK